ncbi:DUF1778 domain-containing protein [Burkholderia gladioli]|uniref:type II toxin-antitoxin system TacA family antitoxin n=1 Tax=Burkholderia gladioli TaxID=28095 RepID=UPI0016402E8A|nr:DUF1778 domain-containing protein [Burkholderia gladioli]
MATTRFEARVEADVLSVIRRAAEIQGRTMSDFVVSAAREAAQRAISDAEVIRLSVADSERFAAAILWPAAPEDALQRALDRHDQLLRDE